MNIFAHPSYSVYFIGKGYAKVSISDAYMTRIVTVLGDNMLEKIKSLIVRFVGKLPEFVRKEREVFIGSFRVGFFDLARLGVEFHNLKG